MEEAEIPRLIGAMDARIEAINIRLSEHISEERERDIMILKTVQKIENTLAEATGAKRLFIWLLGVFFAAIALAKGWIGIGKP